jgi:hypothetical protein
MLRANERITTNCDISGELYIQLPLRTAILTFTDWAAFRATSELGADVKSEADHVGHHKKYHELVSEDV